MDVLFICQRIFIENIFVNGGILVSGMDGVITKIFRNQESLNSWMYNNEPAEVIDFGNLVLMPGLIDTHVHINEPGRTDWEGFETATKAAAAGGFTTIVDMPLNSIPPTTTVDNLNKKLRAANGKIYVDVAFWGGVIPGNEKDLRDLVRNGVVGFKCFLCPSGVDEFPSVTRNDIELALEKLENTGTVLAFHAEFQNTTDKEDPSNTTINENRKYETYLKTRPSEMEIEGFELISSLSKKYNTRLHIVHLSAADVLPKIKQARSEGKQISVETCHHYLSISAEEIPDAHTEYKCAPPIRSEKNREKLWQGLIDGDIDMIVSDHSPSTPGVKLLTSGKTRGDFLKAWGGISSVQFGLSLFWTHCSEFNLGIEHLQKFLCQEPAKLVGLDSQKGKIEIGYDADFVVWDPDDSFVVTSDIVQFKNKANPYMGKRLKGVIHSTVVRGYHVYQRYENFTQPMGKILRKKLSRGKIVKFNQ